MEVDIAATCMRSGVRYCHKMHERFHAYCGNIYLQISYILWQYLPPDLMHVVAISTSRSHACCGNIYLQISYMLWQYLTPDLMHLVAISNSRSHACCGSIYLQISCILWQLELDIATTCMRSGVRYCHNMHEIWR
jgi:hypothetical protein